MQNMGTISCLVAEKRERVQTDRQTDRRTTSHFLVPLNTARASLSLSQKKPKPLSRGVQKRYRSVEIIPTQAMEKNIFTLTKATLIHSICNNKYIIITCHRNK